MRIVTMSTAWIITTILLGNMVSASQAAWPPFQCFADVCNLSGPNEFCDKAEPYRCCRQCSDVLQDCFTPQQEANCSEYCYANRHQQDLEKKRVAGCSLPPPPENGHFNSNETHLPYNATMEMSCAEGYRLLCNPNIRCGNFSVLEWSSPKCEVITCGSVTPTLHGTWSLPRTQPLPGITATLVCHNGYHVEGDPLVTCTSSGEWEFKHKYSPVCLPDTNSPGDRTALIVLGVLLAISCCGFFGIIFLWVRYKRNDRRRNSKTKDNNTTEDPTEGQLLQQVSEDTVGDTVDANIPTTNDDSVRSSAAGHSTRFPIQETDNHQQTAPKHVDDQ